MIHSIVYTVIFILSNLNYYVECVGKRQTVCLKELNAFSVSNTTGNASEARPNICSSKTGCCNKTMEDRMKTHVTRLTMNLIHERNEKARRQFKDVYDDLKGVYIYVLEKTFKSTIVSLQPQVQGKIAQDGKAHIRTLFDEMRISVTRKDLHVQNLTANFFRNFYPVVYQHMVVKRKLPGEFADCLKDNMHLISPFQDVPQTMTEFLIKKLQPIQQYLRSLQTIGHVLDVIDIIELSDECSSELVKMSYCSLCDGVSNVKPCLKYCTSVLSSCLEPFSQIEAQWSSFINKLDNFRNLLAKSLDASAMFSWLQESVSESMSHASHSKVATKVSKHCGNITDYVGNKIISLRKKQTDSTRDLGNGDLYLTTDVQNSYESLPTASDVSRKLIFLQRNLSNIRNYMKMFHIRLCLGNNLSADPTDVSQCWLGSTVGRFRVQPGIVKNDAVLKPDNSQTMKDDIRLFLNKAIADIRRVKSRPSKTTGSGDGSGSGGGSGGSGEPVVDEVYSGTDCNDDDEDCSVIHDQSSGEDNTESVHTEDSPGIDVEAQKSENTTETTFKTTLSSGAITSYYSQTFVRVGLLLLCIVFSRQLLTGATP